MPGDTDTSNDAILYSIIIPTHNSSRYVRRLLDSIPKHYPDLEVIVIDDHSDPHEFDLLQTYFNEAGFAHGLLEHNTGVNSAGAARNLGIQHSSGRWLIFADSDDIFTPAISLAMSRYENSEWDTILFPPKASPNEPDDRFIASLQKLSVERRSQELGYIMASPWSRFIRRDIVLEHGIHFSETMHLNDYLFAVQTFFFSRSYKLDPMPVYEVSIRPGSLSRRRHTIVDLTERIAVQVEVADFLSSRLDTRLYRKVAPTKGHYLLQALLSYGISGLRTVIRIYRGQRIPLLHAGKARQLITRPWDIPGIIRAWRIG
ncbi:MAG: glycosyltransferase family 2 protein [Propionibacteriaceae bacterium]|jgi:glycosyltransferase involved in cell wall biosynthesis|nr:glycosyltransferase family 2 protein [Propionibacteriaceae bacterium]